MLSRILRVVSLSLLLLIQVDGISLIFFIKYLLGWVWFIYIGGYFFYKRSDRISGLGSDRTSDLEAYKKLILFLDIPTNETKE